MPTGANQFTLEQIGAVSVELKQQRICEKEFHTCQRDACPSGGACQFMGTAGTMQVMSEALGLALPHSALAPANLKYIGRMAKQAGKAVAALIEKNIRPRDIVTEQSLHNAIVIHGAIGGSTNALLHLPAIAHEFQLPLSMDLFDQLHRSTPFMVNTRPVGRYSTDMFWYAGGVPRLMLELKDKLHLDVLTVTGKTLGENLEQIEEDLSFYEGYLSNYGLTRSDIIRPLSPQGAIAILKGNIAPLGAVVKYTGPAKKYAGI